MTALQRILTILLIGYTVSVANAQISPGGLGTGNLTTWLRADDLSAGNVTSWSTQYPNGPGTITLTDAGAPYPQLEVAPVNSVSNYNNTIHFSGNNFTGMNPANLQGLSRTPAPNLLDNSGAGHQGSFFSAYYLPVPTASNGHMLLYNEGNDAIQLRNLNNKGRIAIGLLPSNSTSASRDWDENFRPNITSYNGNRSTTTSMKGFNRGQLLPTPTVASQSSGIDGLYIGYSPTIGTSAYNGYIHEFIFFNRDLTATEMTMVHSYLAVKYGVTLSNTGGGINGDYLATSTSLIWDASLTPAYHNDVIGIGRDDVEGLYQRQSHAFDDSTRIYISSLNTTNNSNTGVITNNVSYVMMGHNNGKLSNTIASSNEIPPSVTSRLEREFKVTRTNFSQAFNWDVTIRPCAGFASQIQTSNLRLLVDTDGNFTNAEVYGATDGLTFTLQNNVISVQGITSTMLPDNSTRYITIGYLDIVYSLTSSSPLCNGDDGWISFSVQNTSSPININYNSGGSNFTLNQINNGDTVYFSQSQTSTYSFIRLTSPLSGCGINPGVLANITLVTPPVVGISISEDTTICQNGTVYLSAEASVANSEYHWNFTSDLSPNQSDNPVNETEYSVFAVDPDGCISDTVYSTCSLLPTLTAAPGTNQTICPGFSTELDVSDITGGLSPYTITWSTGETGQGTAMTINSSPSVTSQYSVTITDVCETTPVTYDFIVAVAPLPVPQIATLQATSCNPGNFIITNETDPSMVQSVIWNISDGQTFNSNQEISLTDMATGIYDIQLVVTSPQGCIDSATFTGFIEVYPSPTANFVWSPNPILMFNTEVKFQNLSQLGNTYEWYFEEGSISFSNQFNPVVSFPDGETGEYAITLYTISEFGCVDSITQMVTVLPEVLIYAPNSFTPDGDEFNQTWNVHVEGLDSFDFHLKVFDRWGELIWETTDQSAGWDGTAFGNLLQSGTYIWQLEAGDLLNDNRYTWNGHINLLR